MLERATCSKLFYYMWNIIRVRILDRKEYMKKCDVEGTQRQESRKQHFDWKNPNKRSFFFLIEYAAWNGSDGNKQRCGKFRSKANAKSAETEDNERHVI